MVTVTVTVTGVEFYDTGGRWLGGTPFGGVFLLEWFRGDSSS